MATGAQCRLRGILVAVVCTVAGNVLAAPAASTPPQGPAVAVLSFEPRGGANPALAQVVQEGAVQQLRDGGRFSRVVSQKDVEALLGVEALKQMYSCDSAGCIAELAGSLNADYVLLGSVTRVGDTVVLNARLVLVRTGQAVATTQRKVTGADERILDEVAPALQQMLLEAGLAQDPAKAAKAASPAPQPAGATGAAEPPPRRFSVAGVGAIVLGGLMGAAGVVGGFGVGMACVLGGMVLATGGSLVAGLLLGALGGGAAMLVGLVVAVLGVVIVGFGVRQVFFQ